MSMVSMGCSADAFAKTARWMDAMLCLTTRPNVVIFGSVVAASSWTQAMCLVRLLLTRGLELSPPLIGAIEMLLPWQRSLQTRSSLKAFNAGLSNLDWNHALQQLNSVRRDTFLRPGIVSFNTVINKIEDHWAWATWLWASICGNTRTLNATLKSFEATTWRWGLELFERAQKVSIQADLVTLNTSASQVTKGLQWELAQSLLTKISKTLRKDAVSLVAGMNSCEKGACWTSAINSLDQDRMVGMMPGVIASNAALGAMAAKKSDGTWSITLHVLEAFQVLQVRPDVATLGTSMAQSGGEEKSSWRSTLQLLSKMRCRVYGLQIPCRNVRDDIRSFA